MVVYYITTQCSMLCNYSMQCITNLHTAVHYVTTCCTCRTEPADADHLLTDESLEQDKNSSSLMTASPLTQSSCPATSTTTVQHQLLQCNINYYSATSTTTAQHQLLQCNINNYSATSTKIVQHKLLQYNINYYSATSTTTVQHKLLQCNVHYYTAT